MILSKQESNIHNLSINYCIFDHRKLNLVEIRHDLFFAVMDLGLSEETTKCYLDLGPLSLTSSMVLSPILKKLLILKRPKSNLLSFLDITCSVYLIGILIQAEEKLYQP